MGLQRNDTWFDIVSLWPAILVMRNLRRVVAVEVVSRLALAGRILALVLIAHTCATGHLAIAFALPLATWSGCERQGSLSRRAEPAEDSHGAQAARERWRPWWSPSGVTDRDRLASPSLGMLQ